MVRHQIHQSLPNWEKISYCSAKNTSPSPKEENTSIGKSSLSKDTASPTNALISKKKYDISSSWIMMKSLFRYVWPRGEYSLRARVLVAMSFLIGSKILNVQVPVLFKTIIDSLNISSIASTTSPELLTLPLAAVIGYGAARAGAALFNEARGAIFAKVAQKAIRKVATTTLLHLLNMDLNFHLNRQTGSLSRAIERGTRGINFILTAMVFNVLPTIFEILLVCSILQYRFGSSFSSVAFSTMLVYTGFTFAVTQWRTRFRKMMNATENEAAGKALDSLINFETVKLFNNEQLETTRYDRVMEQHDRASLKSQSSLAMLNFGQNLIFTISLTWMMWMACQGIKNGTMTIGDMVMINTLLFQLSLPLNFLGTMYREIKQSLIDMESMFQLLNVRSAIVDSPCATPLVIKGGHIEFDRVSFGYNKERKILNKVSFEIQPNTKVAIVGSSGSGKSTILRLLYRFYDADEGSIRIDGKDIRDVTLTSLRASIGVIPQDTVLFNDTIYYNISYGNVLATEEQVYDAARKAHIHEQILKMPEGYQTIVGERGLKLSGGEKQRVSIARAILKNPSILFCDEATSAIDSSTETFIQASLKELFKHKTSIYIAHRLSSIVDADNIIVIGSEGILEQGTHQHLLQNQDGIYRGMWLKQQANPTINSA